MDNVIHHSPSVGGVVKKVLAINPHLSAPVLVDLIRQATRRQGESAGEFASIEVIDVEKALELAHLSLTSTTSAN